MKNATLQAYWKSIVGAPMELAYADRHRLLLEQLERFTQQFVSLGNQSYAYIAQANSKELDLIFAYLINFDWSEQAKTILLLWRDLLFEQQRASILLRDHLIDEQASKTLWQQSNAIQNSAWTNLENYLEGRLVLARATARKILKKWKLQRNPWSIYQKQFLEILEQGKELEAVYPKLKEAQEFMQHISRLILGAIERSISTIASIRELSEATINVLLAIDETNLKKELIASVDQLKKLEAQIQFEASIDSVLSGLEQYLNHIPKRLSFTMSVQEGYLEQRHLDLRNKVQLWLESEVYPLLDEVWESTEGSSNGLKMMFIHIKNRIDFLVQEDLETTTQAELQLAEPLLAFLKDLNHQSEVLDKIKANLENRLATYFKFGQVYDPQSEFLPVFLQKSANRYFLLTDGWLGKSKKWLDRQWKKWKVFKTKLSREQALGMSEKIVRCIQNRQPDTKNVHYTNIFMTKGYIGESFLVGREEQLNHVENIIDNWHKGYRGAVLVTGERLSGKTLFSEIVANRYFTDNFIHLSPNEVLTIHDHQITLAYDLAEALSFVQKHTAQDKPMVWIDDLELWWDTQQPIYQNIQALSHWIDSFSTQFFVLVNTNTTLKKQLDHLCDIDRVFQAAINMDGIKAEAVQRAIRIRHGATHKKLINTKKTALNTPSIQRLCKKIYKVAMGNIGEALNIWVGSTYYMDENHVQHDLGRYRLLPYFLNADTKLILHTMLQYKRLNEHRLEKLFGPMFAQQYATVIKRMLSMGILRRQLDGWLEIDELIVNDLKRMIENYKK